MEEEAKALLTKHGLLRTEELYQYLMETSVYPRESPLLRDLRAATDSHPLSFMGTAPDEGQFLSLLLQTMNAKKTIEIGVFTGYSLLLTALAIPDDGMITAIDVDREAYEKIGLPFIKQAGVEHKINFINFDAHKVLDQLLEDPKNHGSFDFAFVDADKSGYKKYHEKMLKLLKVGGIVVYDNTLWAGTVAMAEEKVPELIRNTRKATMDFNKFIAADDRVQISHAPLGDGITICRRLPSV